MNNSVFNDFQKRAESYERLSRWITDKIINDTAVNMIKENCSLKGSGNNLSSFEDDDFSLIDVGCGTGYLSYCMSRKYPMIPITLLDLSPNMLEVAKRRIPNARVINTALEDYAAVTLKRYDAAIMRQVLHYVDDPVVAMDSIKKLLKKYGNVYIGQFTVKDEASDSWHERLVKLISVNKKRSFTVKKLTDLCYGFKIKGLESTDYEENLQDYFARKTSENSYEAIYNEMLNNLNDEIMDSLKVRIDDGNLYFTVQFTHMILQAT